jgi:phosphoglycerate dehydrogenase-like enzyme
MRILFAAHEHAWGGFLGMIKAELPEHTWAASGHFGFESLKGFDVLIPTMSDVRREHLVEADRLRLIQQCGAGLEGVDLLAARDRQIPVANAVVRRTSPSDVLASASGRQFFCFF